MIIKTSKEVEEGIEVIRSSFHLESKPKYYILNLFLSASLSNNKDLKSNTEIGSSTQSKDGAEYKDELFLNYPKAKEKLSAMINSFYNNDEFISEKRLSKELEYHIERGFVLYFKNQINNKTNPFVFMKDLMSILAKKC